jgi:hypothetical protein
MICFCEEIRWWKVQRCVMTERLKMEMAAVLLAK